MPRGRGRGRGRGGYRKRPVPIPDATVSFVKMEVDSPPGTPTPVRKRETVRGEGYDYGNSSSDGDYEDIDDAGPSVMSASTSVTDYNNARYNRRMASGSGATSATTDHNNARYNRRMASISGANPRTISDYPAVVAKPGTYYRNTTLGRTLQDSLVELMEMGKMTYNLAQKILIHYDVRMRAGLSRSVPRVLFTARKVLDNVETGQVIRCELKDAEFSIYGFGQQDRAVITGVKSIRLEAHPSQTYSRKKLTKQRNRDARKCSTAMATFDRKDDKKAEEKKKEQKPKEKPRKTCDWGQDPNEASSSCASHDEEEEDAQDKTQRDGRSKDAKTVSFKIKEEHDSESDI